MQLGTLSQKLTQKSLDNVHIIFGHPLIICIVMFTIFSINIISQWFYDWSPSFIICELLFGILGIAMPILAAWLYRRTYNLLQTVHNIVDMPNDQITTWFEKQLGELFGVRWPYLGLGLLTLAGIISTNVFGIPWSGIVGFFYYLFSALFFFVTGTVAWAYLNSLLILIRLEKLEIKGALFEWPENQFKYLNKSYLEMFAAGVAIYFTAVIAVWVSPGGSQIALNTTLGRLWIFPVAGFVVGFFFSFQYLIHRIILRSKHRRLDIINKLINNLFNTFVDAPSADKSKIISDLLNWRNQISKESDWPLEFKSSLTIVSGLLLPTIKTIIDLLSK